MFRSLTDRSRIPKTLFFSLAIFAISFSSSNIAKGQSTDSRGKNNPYSPSPAGKAAAEAPSGVVQKPVQNESGPVARNQNAAAPEIRPTTAQRNIETPKAAETRLLAPTEIYKVGIGDVLFINLKNSVQGSGYYTVRANGTIDFPLAGDNVLIADQTADKIEEILESGVTLFANPRIEVKVREYASHKITVSGMAASSGEKSLRREAIPLFVIRADANVDPKATKVIIKRGPRLKPEFYELREPNTDNILIFPGNTVEFTTEFGSQASSGSLYFIGGEIISSGQKALTPGLTLYQAVIASGGTKGDLKKAIIRRKNDKGLLISFLYDLKSIKNGKAADPVLISGDVVEIRN